MRNTIFICYRRADSGVYAGRIYDHLVREFPKRVFRDVDNLTHSLRWIGWLLMALGFSAKEVPQPGRSEWRSPGNWLSIAVMAIGVSVLFYALK
jgi:hypothetical protein